ncbi:hypothetical protein AAW14_01435 [Streptomyces hygroscopicus]|uniref:hypothetical protein n=1 Tax=Streptomyces hygroscopicus TaxID=1912 RepID=UPI00223FBF93|nr:hypothetical protein [Streptomyces hygroscopicus]MCW7940721.1 hypothetical protein [Streptomyces hygroscopicus]
MTHGATTAPHPIPRANAALAVGCEVCNGWGSVITAQGRHKLCLGCQPDADREVGESSGTPRAE